MFWWVYFQSKENNIMMGWGRGGGEITETWNLVPSTLNLQVTASRRW